MNHPSLKIPFRKRFNILNVTALSFIVLAALAASNLEGQERNLDYLQNLKSFLVNFFPPDLNVLPKTLSYLVETIEIALVATLFSILISVPLGLGSARNLSPRALNLSCRIILNMIRTIPSLIWALLAVAVMGPTAWAGVVALTWYSVGYLGKFFGDAFESVDMKVFEGLRRIGSQRISAFQYGVWPSMRPLISAHSLWMLEYNIRSASIIGYVGAGGIGAQLYAYQEYYQWDRFATVLITIFIIVVGLDFFGEYLRKKLLSPANY